jgi:hypothetical protein
MLLCTDTDATSADLASGALARSSCGPGRATPVRVWPERIVPRRDGSGPQRRLRLVPGYPCPGYRRGLKQIPRTGRESHLWPGYTLNSEHVLEYLGVFVPLVLLLLHYFPEPGRFH